MSSGEFIEGNSHREYQFSKIEKMVEEKRDIEDSVLGCVEEVLGCPCVMYKGEELDVEGLVSGVVSDVLAALPGIVRGVLEEVLGGADTCEGDGVSVDVVDGGADGDRGASSWECGTEGDI